MGGYEIQEIDGKYFAFDLYSGKPEGTNWLEAEITKEQYDRWCKDGMPYDEMEKLKWE